MCGGFSTGQVVFQLHERHQSPQSLQQEEVTGTENLSNLPRVTVLGLNLEVTTYEAPGLHRVMSPV